MKKLFVGFLFLALPLFLAGCYWNADVEPDQVGVKISRNAIQNCVAPGVYTDMGWFSELKSISRGTVTFQVQDPEVATKDNQAIGLSVTIQARRSEDCDAVTNLLTNWPALTDDQALMDTISATAREAMKNGVRAQTLNQLLDDRNGLADGIRSSLENDASRYNVYIVNVTIENVAPAAEWLAIQQQKANLAAETDKERQRQELIRQQGANDQLDQEQRTLVYLKQLDTEKAKTDVEVEIAKREGEKTAAAQQVYVDNPQAYNLKYLELMAKVIGDKATIWFLDPNMQLNTLFDANGQPQTVIPVLPTPVAQP
jgi:uncharacterized membrane protein YqiK